MLLEIFIVDELASLSMGQVWESANWNFVLCVGSQTISGAHGSLLQPKWETLLYKDHWSKSILVSALMVYHAKECTYNY